MEYYVDDDDDDEVRCFVFLICMERVFCHKYLEFYEHFHPCMWIGIRIHISPFLSALFGK